MACGLGCVQPRGGPGAPAQVARAPPHLSGQWAKARSGSFRGEQFSFLFAVLHLGVLPDRFSSGFIFF